MTDFTNFTILYAQISIVWNLEIDYYQKSSILSDTNLTYIPIDSGFSWLKAMKYLIICDQLDLGRKISQTVSCSWFETIYYVIYYFIITSKYLILI